MHLPPLSFGIFEDGKYIWVGTHGLSVWMCIFSKCWGKRDSLVFLAEIDFEVDL